MVVYYQFSQLDNIEPIPASSDNQVSRGVPIIPYNDPSGYRDPTIIDSDYLVWVRLVGLAGSSTILSRSNYNIDVWDDDHRAILPPRRDGEKSPVTGVSITFDREGSCVVLVGWNGTAYKDDGDDDDGGGQAWLTLRTSTSPGLGEQPNQVLFKKSDTLIVGVAGHTQSLGPNNPWVVTSCGARQIYEELMQDYTIRLYPEDPGNQNWSNPNQCGVGADRAYEFIYDGFNKHGLRHLGIYGYSHGGGSVYQLADDLSGVPPRHYSLDWAGYIDAVVVDVGRIIPVVPETRMPPLAKHLFNRYQSQVVLFEPHGAAVDGANDQQDTDLDAAGNPPNPMWPGGLDHTNDNRRGISEDPQVRQQLIASLKSRLPG